jgi:predicted membrane-bound spermidine synthase
MELMGVIPGEGLGMIPILYSSFLIFAPLSITHGALFAFGCKLYSLHFVSERKASSIGKVYVHETLGTIVGAVAFTYFFVPFFHSIEIALGMVGIAAGSFAMTSLLEGVKRDFASFVGLELLIILFSGALPAIFLLFSPCLDRPAVFFLFQVIFLVLSFLSGLLIGAQFPLASKIYLKRSRDLSGTAGLLYGADLAGGWIGGLLGGVVLLPVLGLVQTCIIVLILKLTSVGVLVFPSFIHKRSFEAL